MKSPFVHKFATANNKYVFDVNTSAILKVDDTIWDIIDFFRYLDKDQIITKYSHLHDRVKLLSAYEEIETMQQKEGCLLANYPKQAIMPYEESCIQERITKQTELVLLNVTEACNFRCSYCVFSGIYSGYRLHSNRMMSWDVAKKAIDEFLNNSHEASRRSVGFYGGEPLLNFELIQKCVNYIKQEPSNADINFTVTTNGSLLDTKVGNFLASSGFCFNISLDGPQYIHDKQRVMQNGDGTWHCVVNNVTSFLNNHPEYKTNGKMGINNTITPGSSIKDLDEYSSNCDFLTDNVVLNISLARENGTTYFDSLKQKDPSEENALHREFLNDLISGKINENPFNRNFKFKRAYFEKQYTIFHKRNQREDPLKENVFPCSICLPSQRRRFVSVDGDYYPCERVPFSEYTKLGNIYDGINVSKVIQLYLDWLDCNAEECKSCWCMRICTASCYSEANEHGVITKKTKESACESSRKRTHGILINYCSILEINPNAFDYMKNITLS